MGLEAQHEAQRGSNASEAEIQKAQKAYERNVACCEKSMAGSHRVSFPFEDLLPFCEVSGDPEVDKGLSAPMAMLPTMLSSDDYIYSARNEITQRYEKYDAIHMDIPDLTKKFVQDAIEIGPQYTMEDAIADRRRGQKWAAECVADLCRCTVWFQNHPSLRLSILPWKDEEPHRVMQSFAGVRSELCKRGAIFKRLQLYVDDDSAAANWECYIDRFLNAMCAFVRMLIMVRAPSDITPQDVDVVKRYFDRYFNFFDRSADLALLDEDLRCNLSSDSLRRRFALIVFYRWNIGSQLSNPTRAVQQISCPMLAVAQGFNSIGTVFSLIGSAWDFLKDLATGVARSASILLKPFFKSFVSSVFGVLIGDWFPFNVLAAVCNFLNTIFHPIYEAFADLFDLLSEGATPTDFADAFCTGTTGQKISRWVVGIVSFAVLAWLFTSLGMFTAKLFQPLFSAIQDALAPLFPDLFTLNSTQTVYVPQGLPSAGPVVNVGSAILTLVMALCSAFHAFPIAEKMSSFVSKFPSIHRGLKECFTAIISLLPVQLQYALALVSSDETKILFADMENWVLESSAVLVCASNLSALMAEDFSQRVLTCEAEGNRLMQKYNEYERKEGAQRFADFSRFQSNLVRLAKVKQQMMQMNSVSAGRPEPAFLMIFGPAGAGKTLFTSLIPDLFSGIHGYNGAIHAQPQPYSKIRSDPYWSALQQDLYPIILLDEIWQNNGKSSSLNGPNVQETLLDLISEAAFMPPMPAVEPSMAGSKGTTITSTLVIGIYNSLLPSTIEVEPTALVRRMGYNFEIVPPTFDRKVIVRDVCYFMRLVDEKVDGLPNELRSLSPGFYSCPTTLVDGVRVPDLSSITPVVVDASIYRSTFRFRRHYVTWEDSTAKTRADPNTMSVDEMVEIVKEAVNIRVVRYLKLLESRGLRHRTDFNAFITSLMLTSLSKPVTSSQEARVLLEGVSYEVDEFVRTSVMNIETRAAPKRITVFEDVPSQSEGVEAQGLFSRRNRTLVRSRPRDFLPRVTQADAPFSTALLSLAPRADDKIETILPQQEFPARTYSPEFFRREIEELCPNFEDFFSPSTIAPDSAEFCSLINPTERVAKKFPVLRNASKAKQLAKFLTLAHPADAEAARGARTKFKIPADVLVQYTKFGDLRVNLIVFGDIIDSWKALTGYAEFYVYSKDDVRKVRLEKSPVELIDWWSDNERVTLARNVRVEDRYARKYVCDLLDVSHEDRIYYPDVLAETSKSMFDVTHVSTTGKWSYCVNCLHFYPPSHSHRYMACPCGEHNDGLHELRWFLDDVANRNLTSLSTCVPFQDYFYFCAMACNLLWLTFVSSWEYTSAVAQSALCVHSVDSLKQMFCQLSPSLASIEIDPSTNDYILSSDKDYNTLYEEETRWIAKFAVNRENPFMMPKEYSEVVQAHRSESWSLAKWFGVGSMAVGVIVALVKVISKFTGSDDDTTHLTAESALPTKLSRAPAPLTKTPARLTRLGATAPQGYFGSSEIPTCELSLDDSPAVHAFIPHTSYVFTYVHGLAAYLSSGVREWHLTIDGKTISFPYVDEYCVIDLAHDLMCVYVPPRFLSPRKDLLRLVASEAELPYAFGVNVSLAIGHHDYIAIANPSPGPVQYPVSSADPRFALWKHDFVFQYPIVTVAGDCGSLCRAVEGRAAGKLIGFHVARQGNRLTGVGCSAPLWRELLMELMQAIDPGVTSKAIHDSSSFDMVEIVDKIETQGPQNFGERLANLAGPNFVSMEPVPCTERVNVPTTNCYISTPFAEEPKFQGKYPSIMTPVANGDPVVNAFTELANIECPPIDENLLARCQAEQLEKLKKLNYLGCARRLTLREALAGIPGLLASLRIQTSSGYPLCLYGSHGKSSFVKILPDGRVMCSTFFRDRVMAIVDALEKHDESVFRRYPFYWLAFMKDELRPLKKIQSVATRMIYCNSLEWMVAARMMFGALQVAFNNNAGRSIFASGINVNSYDLQSIADYLGQISTERCIAGDYSGFDKHYHPSFQRAAYANMRDLGLATIRDFDGEAFDMFVRHELTPDVQFGDVRMKFRHSHFSGCFFTTAENCLVNELYFMYCFYLKYPNLSWNKETRFVALGDDHLVACSAEIPEFNARTVCGLMSRIGQVYTDENKKIPDYDYKPFSECGFLGSTPQRINGRWVGALRLETLYSNMSHVTKQTDLEVLIETFLDLCAIWPYDVYTQYLNDINAVWRKTHAIAFSDEYIARRNRQAARTADSGAGFWKPEGGVPMADQKTSLGNFLSPDPFYGNASWVPQSPAVLTRLKRETLPLQSFSDGARVPNLHLSRPRFVRLTQAQGPAVQTDIQSDVQRPVNETSAQTVDTNRAVGVTYASLTSPTKSQMYLTTFEWSSSDVQDRKLLSLNVPGDCIKQAMQQTVPFMYYQYWKGDVELMFQVNGNNFQAGALCAVLLPLKIKAEADVIRNNYFSGEHVVMEPRQSTACTLRVPYRYYTDVMSTHGAMNATDVLGTVNVYVLSPLVSSEPTAVTVTVFVSFPNSAFYGPKVQDVIAQGPDGVTVGDLVGLIPGSDIVTKPLAKVNKILNSKFIPMDDTPVSGGAIPTAQQFPSIAGTFGAKSSVKPTLNPTTMYRKTEEIFDPQETKIESLCGREGIIRSFDWMDSQAPGTSLLSIPLNSLCSDPPTEGMLMIPVNLAILNMFMYWHADLEFKLYVFKTPFHSGRIRVSLSLGGKLQDTTATNLQTQNLLFSQILDFSDAECRSFTVPFIAAREFLYTVASNVADNTDKIGYLNLVVLNKLVTSTATVSKTVKCVLTVSLRDTRVAIPHPVPPVTFDSTIPSVTVTPQGPQAEASVEDPEPVPVPFGDPTGPSETPTVSGDLDMQSHFPYAVKDLMEVARRLVPISVARETYSKATQGADSKATFLTTFIVPNQFLYGLFRAYSGGLRVRLVSNAFLASYIPELAVRKYSLPSTLLPSVGWNAVSPTNLNIISPTPASAELTRVPNFNASEFAYPLPNGKYYIDLELPYETPVNFYGPYGQIYYHTAQIETYRPALILGLNGTDFDGTAMVGAADDGLFGIFCPPAATFYWWVAPNNEASLGALD